MQIGFLEGWPLVHSMENSTFEVCGPEHDDILLSVGERVQIVKSVVQSMMIYFITTYSWPAYLIKDMERYNNIVVCSNDIKHSKIVIVTWKKLCIPIKDRGLGIREFQP